MIKTLIDLLQFLYSTLPLITCVFIFTVLSVWLSKSIKKHAKIYYILLALPSLMFAIPFIGRWFGLELFSFGKIPFLGGILRDYIHMGTFGFPLLIIIMYMGALDMKITWVKKLMSIRKELSIISGFPVLIHSLVRVTSNFPGSLKYFFDHEEYMANRLVTSGLGAFLTNFSYILGILMVVLFLILWITSFDSVHKRMGGVKWKKTQKWSYVLYAMLFIHSLGISVGGLLNPRRGGENSQRATVENIQSVPSENVRNNTIVSNVGQQTNSEQSEKRSGKNSETEKRRNKDRSASVNPVGQERSRRNSDSTNPERESYRKRHTENSENREYAEAKQSDSKNTEISERRNKNSSWATNTSKEGYVQDNKQTSNDRSNEQSQTNSVQSETKEGNNQEQVARSGRGQSIGFSDIKVSSSTKRYIHIISVVSIFGSYLFLRLRKARKKASKKNLNL